MSDPNAATSAPLTIPASIYVREFFARGRVLTGIVGGIGMLALLATLPGNLILHIFLAALAGFFIYSNVRALREYARRRMLVNITAQGDREKWRALAPGILPTQSLWRALRSVRLYGAFMLLVAFIGGPYVIIAAASTTDVINGVAIIVAGLGYALSDAYERSTHILSLEELRKIYTEAFDKTMPEQTNAQP